MGKTVGGIVATRTPKYTAPALEKGLDILEHLSRSEAGLTQAEIARAVHQPGQLPHSVNMRTNENYVDTSSAPAQITTAPELPSVPSVTSFSDVLHDFTPTKDAILLALGDGGEKLTAPIGQLCHVALCGATGQGKSNLLRLLLPQLQYLSLIHI